MVGAMMFDVGFRSAFYEVVPRGGDPMGIVRLIRRVFLSLVVSLGVCGAAMAQD